jgi:hypothetical protein
VIGGKKSTQICVDINSLFFHTVPKLVVTLVITDDGIFQALPVEGHILIPKPFPDLGFDGVVRWKLSALETFFQFTKHEEVQEGQVGAVQKWPRSKNGFRSRMSPSTTRAWVISLYVMTSA